MVAGVRRDLLDLLVAEVTVGETHFFRIGPQIAALQRTVLPDLIARRSAGHRLGIWSAGCSTGEEAFTLAILLHETLPAREDWDVTLLATDISRRALDTARQAIYGAWSFRETPQAVRERYFAAIDKRWCLAEPVRRMVHFAQLNLAADAFPSPGPHGPDLDLILCRNVTIYFSTEAAQRLYRRFAAALAPGGWLVLGPSDPVPDQLRALAPVYLPGAVLWRRSTDGVPSLPQLSTRPARSDAPGRPCRDERSSTSKEPRTALRQAARQARTLVPLEPPTGPAVELETVRALVHGRGSKAARAG